MTNLSSVNPTRVNGEALQQSERLKHGDVITIIDRSFRYVVTVYDVFFRHSGLSLALFVHSA